MSSEKTKNERLHALVITALISSGISGLGGCTSAAIVLAVLGLIFWMGTTA